MKMKITNKPKRERDPKKVYWSLSVLKNGELKWSSYTK